MTAFLLKAKEATIIAQLRQNRTLAARTSDSLAWKIALFAAEHGIDCSLSAIDPFLEQVDCMIGTQQTISSEQHSEHPIQHP